MQDRFHGFRYEVNVKERGSALASFVDAMKAMADAKGCFGWVQAPLRKPQTVVGELRCTKLKGKDVQNWLETQSQGDGNKFNVHVYEDTKIRLHFTYFKQLDEERDTCFTEAPHRCTDMNAEDIHPGNANGHAEL